MSIKTAVTREDSSFDTLLVYRELTYRLAYARFKEPPEDVDAELEKLKAAAKEQELEAVADVSEIRKVLGLQDYELSKVETYLVPMTLNTVTRGIATKGDREIRFYVERP